MKIAIFSDQHLPRRSSFKKDVFLQLLGNLRKDCDELWLLGDIFDLLVGNFKFWIKEHHALFRELNAWTSSGKKVVWIEGNHDFHIGRLLTSVGAEHSADALSREVPGPNGRSLRVYLDHGDLVDTEDLAYLKWRATIRHPNFVRTLEKTPEFLAKHLLLPLSEQLSKESRKRDEAYEIPRIRERFRAFAQNKFSEGFDAVFLGHSHVYDSVFSEKIYLNLGSWFDPSLRYAIWEPARGTNPEVLVYK